ncbi:MAG: ADP-ribosylglycohydrolase family protein [Candidatus Thorarchaeota archaeon]
MNKIYMSEAEYYDKVYACWMGKSIGGTLGAPYETKKSMNALKFYKPIPKKSAPNDDLDLQLIWLKMLEDVGSNPSLQDFANYWKRYAFAYPWNEYGFSQRNLKRGLLPPISGSFENYYIDEMGSPIRSEIWACISPGDPQLAALMAWKDSVIDHAGGEGMYGEMFWAAVESAAFVLNDPKSLIIIGLAMIPIYSLISRVTREVLWCFENNLNWMETRERIILFYGHNEPCNAPQNHAFILIGWLYGSNFGDSLCKAVNCGYDTDCTAATLGALLGILNGYNSIPEKWIKPIGNSIS